MLRGVSSILRKILFAVLSIGMMILVVPSVFNLQMYSSDKNMESSVKKGSMLYISKKIDVSNGDLIVYKKYDDGQFLVAKVLEHASDGTIYIKDGELNDNEGILSEQLIGKVAFTIPVVGTIISLMKTPIGILMGALLLSILISFSVFADISELKNKDIEINSEFDVIIIEKIYHLYTETYYLVYNIKRRILNKLGYFVDDIDTVESDIHQ